MTILCTIYICIIIIICIIKIISAFNADGKTDSRARWRGALKSRRKCAHSKAAAYWKSEINEAGGNVRRVWRTVDNLLGKTKSSAIPRFSPDDCHDFIDSKIAGVRVATATAAPPIYKPCSTLDLASFTTVSVDDVIRVTFKTVCL